MTNYERERLRRVYLTSVEGSNEIVVAVVPGGLLNQRFQTTEYDPARSYAVSSEGIRIVPEYRDQRVD